MPKVELPKTYEASQIEDNIYKIYKSTEISNPKQELIIEGDKEDFNCNIICKYKYFEENEGIYYYSIEVNRNVFSVGPVEIKKKEIVPEGITQTQKINERKITSTF